MKRGNKTTNHFSPKRRRKVRARLFDQQGGLCHWCKCKMTIEKAAKMPPNYGTFEHLHPYALGGRMTADNIVLACHACNEYRGARLNSALMKEARRAT